MKESVSATIVVALVLLLFLGVAIFSKDALHNLTSTGTPAGAGAPLSRAY